MQTPYLGRQWGGMCLEKCIYEKGTIYGRQCIHYAIL